MEIVYEKTRRTGRLLSYFAMMRINLTLGESVFYNGKIETLNNFMNDLDLEITDTFVTPNLKIEYNWNGSVRRIYQPEKIHTGYNVKLKQ